jgi:hypothetical protein
MTTFLKVVSDRIVHSLIVRQRLKIQESTESEICDSSISIESVYLYDLVSFKYNEFYHTVKD